MPDPNTQIDDNNPPHNCSTLEAPRELDGSDRVDAPLDSRMLEEHTVNSVTYPAMTWAQSLEWLLAHGFDTVVWPTMMSGGCVDSQSARSTLALLDEHLNLDANPEGVLGLLDGSSVGPDLHGGVGIEGPELYVIETGLNALEREVAWVYESTVPMEEWHEFQQGAEWYRQPGDEEPAEHPWSHWPHCALGVRRGEPG